MTFERRNEIFSKEALSIDDVKELMGVSYDTAQKLIQTIRATMTGWEYKARCTSKTISNTSIFRWKDTLRRSIPPSPPVLNRHEQNVCTTMRY